MPTYEYRCGKCGKIVTAIQRMTEPALTEHDGCGGALERLISGGRPPLTSRKSERGSGDLGGSFDGAMGGDDLGAGPMGGPLGDAWGGGMGDFSQAGAMGDPFGGGGGFDENMMMGSGMDDLDGGGLGGFEGGEFPEEDGLY